MEVIKTIDVYIIHVDSVSFTYLMDIDLRSRSFQHTSMIYKEVVGIVVGGYSNGQFSDRVSEWRAIGRPIIQYMETDWSFLKRLSSHFNSYLVPSLLSEGPQFYFGQPNPDRGSIEVHNYSVHRDFGRLKRIQTEVPGAYELDFTEFEVEVYDIYKLGDKVTFGNVQAYISRTEYSYENSIIRNTLRLTQRKGMSTLFVPNNNIAGVSLFGKVIAVARDRVKIHLDIDEVQNLAEAYWYPYATMYASEGEVGWFCMPELGDAVRLYHPDGDEGNAMVINSIKAHDPNEDVERLDPEHRMIDPDVKYLRSAFGKEVRIRPDGIDVIAKDDNVFMSLNDDGTITIISNDKISIAAVNDIEVKAKNIFFEALERISMKSKGSTIDLETDIEVKGEEVKTN